MIAVAAAGMALIAGRETVKLCRVSHAHRRRAAEYARMETMWRGMATQLEKRKAKERADAETFRRLQIPEDVDDLEKRGIPLAAFFLGSNQPYHDHAKRHEDMARMWEDEAAPLLRRAEYYARLRGKHERVVRRPWGESLPDPTSPPSDEGRLMRGLASKPGARDLLTEWRGPSLSPDRSLRTTR
jgi:hypothetical protein